MPPTREDVDLLAGGAGVVAGDLEVAVVVGEDVVADGVEGDAGLAGIEHGDAGCAVAGGVRSEEIDVGPDDGLLAAVDVANDCGAWSGGGRCWSCCAGGAGEGEGLFLERSAATQERGGEERRRKADIR